MFMMNMMNISRPQEKSLQKATHVAKNVVKHSQNSYYIFMCTSTSYLSNEFCNKKVYIVFIPKFLVENFSLLVHILLPT